MASSESQDHNPNAPSMGSVQMPPGQSRILVRFSSSAVKVLRDWFRNHQDHPYPSPKDLASLQSLAGLQKAQVLNWLANARRRTKLRETSMATPPGKDAAGTSPPDSAGVDTPPVDVPPRRGTPAPFSHMSPLQRWENSPPEHEAAFVSDISKAIAAADDDLLVSRMGRTPANASSANSLGTSASSKESASRASSRSSRSRTSRPSGVFSIPESGRRRRRAGKRLQEPVVPRPSLIQVSNRYQCTFCTDTFKTKYDWHRHEKSLHLSLEQWICSPDGPTAEHPETGLTCVYCPQTHPDTAHLKDHNYAACIDRPLAERTFYRKDHLLQHLKLVHNSRFSKWPMAQWKVESENVRSRCGICNTFLNSWNERTDHIAQHFKTGKSMADWKGSWGFDTAIAEMVHNSIPPYLIHSERISPAPFTAVNPPAATPATAYGLIRTELEYYIQNFVDTYGQSPSNRDLQFEGCSVIFGAELVSQPSDSAATASWLRDIFTASEEISRQARLRPLQQVSKSRITPLRINGKNDIFENCEFEQQLRQYISCHSLFGLSTSDYEVQEEAQKIVLGAQKKVGGNQRFVDFLTSLIWDSTSWIDLVRQRTQEVSPEDIADLTLPGDVSYGQQGDSFFFDDDANRLNFLQYGDMNEHDALEGLDISFMHNTASARNETPILDAVEAVDVSGIASGTQLEARVVGSTMTTPPGREGTAKSPDIALSEGLPINAFEPYTPGNQTESTFFLHGNYAYRRFAQELSTFVSRTVSPHNPNNHVPTDDELRYQGRCIVYGDGDPLNQSPADNDEWLLEFKRYVGLTTGEPEEGTTWSIF